MEQSWTHVEISNDWETENADEWDDEDEDDGMAKWI
jgi:hypothetical protein